MRNRAEAADVTVLGFILNEFRAGRRRPVPGTKDRRRTKGVRAPQAVPRPLAIGAGS
jgi:hypothetical protein